MTPLKGAVVLIRQAICGVDLRGELAVVAHEFSHQGHRWLKLEPWLETWPVDHVILRPIAVEVLLPASERTAS